MPVFLSPLFLSLHSVYLSVLPLLTLSLTVRYAFKTSAINILLILATNTILQAVKNHLTLSTYFSLLFTNKHTSINKHNFSSLFFAHQFFLSKHVARGYLSETSIFLSFLHSKIHSFCKSMRSLVLTFHIYFFLPLLLS